MAETQKRAAKKTTKYTRAELLTAASAFGTTDAGMAGALRAADLENGATREQAQAAVDKFNEREV